LACLRILFYVYAGCPLLPALIGAFVGRKQPEPVYEPARHIFRNTINQGSVAGHRNAIIVFDAVR
jgi:hypothetical protein